MAEKRFNHVSCRLRINLRDTDMKSALSSTEYDRLMDIRTRMGISFSHVVTSLVKQALEKQPGGTKDATNE